MQIHKVIREKDLILKEYECFKFCGVKTDETRKACRHKQDCFGMVSNPSGKENSCQKRKSFRAAAPLSSQIFSEQWPQRGFSVYKFPLIQPKLHKSEHIITKFDCIKFEQSVINYLILNVNHLVVDVIHLFKLFHYSNININFLSFFFFYSRIKLEKTKYQHLM